MNVQPDQHENVQHLPWDSGFFGFKIGQVIPRALSGTQATELCDWAQAAQFRCLYWLAVADDPETLRVAREAGFTFTDLRLELTHKPLAIPRTPLPSNLRAATLTDTAMLQTIARETQKDTRFTKDTRFPRDRASQLYAKWILRDQNQNHVLVSTDSADLATGFISYSVDALNSTGHIELLSVSSAHAGRGLGQTLIRTAVSELSALNCSSIEVVTQGTNVAAQRAYQSCGFKSIRAAVWFHRWF